MCGIYKITCLANNKCYVGQSIDILRRWRDEIGAAFSTTDSSYDYPLSRAFRKYGETKEGVKKNFKFEVIEECDRSLLNEREGYWANYYQSYIWQNGYNVAICGYGGCPRYIKLSDSGFWEIIDLLKNSSLTQRRIAELYGTSLDTINKINVGHRNFHYGVAYPIRGRNELQRRQAAKRKNISYQQQLEESEKRKPHVTREEYLAKRVEQQKYYDEHPEEIRINSDKCPPRDVLEKEIYTTSFVALGRKYGVSDKAVAKWCKRYRLPSTRKEIREILKNKNKI